MNAKQFGDKYGRKYVRHVPEWHKKGYLGKSTQDEKTKIYSIPDDIPLPYLAHSNVTKLPTLWKELLDAASGTRSVFPSMYPKFASGVFERHLNDFADAGLIRISKTPSSDAFLELLPAGYEFMTKLTDSDKKNVLDKACKIVTTGVAVAQAFATVWPQIQPLLQTVIK